MSSGSTGSAGEHASRVDALRQVEQEVGVLIRRVRRVIGERARAVHPDLQPPSYLMLGYVLNEGPIRASALSTVFTPMLLQHFTEQGKNPEGWRMVPLFYAGLMLVMALMMFMKCVSARG